MEPPETMLDDTWNGESLAILAEYEKRLGALDAFSFFVGHMASSTIAGHMMGLTPWPTMLHLLDQAPEALAEVLRQKERLRNASA